MGHKRLLCERLPEKGRPTFLNEVEMQHAVKVLRLRDGTKVEAIDGLGGAVITLLRIRGKSAFLELAPPEEQGVRSPVLVESQTAKIVLEQVILKGDAMEWLIEKAVELGVQAVQPLWSDHCVVQTNRKGPEDFRKRWQKTADQSLKQCGRLVRLDVLMPKQIEEVISDLPRTAIRIWADESAASQKGVPSLLEQLLELDTPKMAQEMRYLVGPEGGFSQKEKEILGASLLSNEGFKSHFRVSLGTLILRAETASIFGISVISAVRGHRFVVAPEPSKT